MFLFAVLWLLASFAGSVFCGGLAIGVIQGWEAAYGSVVPLKREVASAVAGVATTAILLLASWRRGLAVGLGDRNAGLGNYPVQRRGVVALLLIGKLASIVAVLVAVLISPALLRAAESMSSSIGRDLSASPASAFITVLLVAVGAPVAEELFFRGWLWTGLRRTWSVVPTALITGLLWMFIHIGTGIYKPLFLIPSAIILSLARHYGNSVRAPILVHAVNNAAALMLAFLPITDK